MASNVTQFPDDKMHDLHVIAKTFNNKEINFHIRANIKEDEMQNVIDNWSVRTDDHSAQSLVDYINSKSAWGFKAEMIK